ncbi:thioredoxin-like protein [Lasiosphaeria miniovina]|uniref:Thioredoxin-like protein n=1 Tax=Lasiosphaeria miniovina TaxID=1954250 RepID=A0AA39ZQU2_9PEZI|nr:thioredoxin-like protein [Lasiosphaeria miniovina]KAK0701972.1 thioredoxin-like protein [Lasiosphaeria miniovina]
MTVHIIETASQFKETIAREKGLVVVDAFATWCGPCKAIAPVISKWSNLDEYKDKVHFTKFDVDELPELAQELGIRAMPTFVFFKDGERLTQFSGANPPALEALVKKHTFEESSPVEKEASPVEASPVGASPVGKESSPDSEKE